VSELVVGYLPEDKKRLEKHLQKLLSHVDIEKTTLVGGIPIKYHLTRLGVKFKEKPSNDLDLVVKDSSAVKPSVTKDFHVSHYHPNDGKKERFYLVLVDEETKTKSDIFGEDFYVVQEREEVDFFGQPVGIVSLEDQLAVSLLEFSRALKGHTLYKQNLDFIRLMAEVADMDKTTKFLKAKPGSQHDIKDKSLSAQELLEKIESYLKDNPEQLQDRDDKERKPYECERCVESEKFPITAMEKIYEILGYAE